MIVKKKDKSRDFEIVKIKFGTLLEQYLNDKKQEIYESQKFIFEQFIDGRHVSPFIVMFYSDSYPHDRDTNGDNHAIIFLNFDMKFLKYQSTCPVLENKKNLSYNHI